MVHDVSAVPHGYQYVAQIKFDIYLKYPQVVTRDRTFIRILAFYFQGLRHNYFWMEY